MNAAKVSGYSLVLRTQVNQYKEASFTSFVLLVCKMCGKGIFLQIRSQFVY